MTDSILEAPEMVADRSEGAAYVSFSAAVGASDEVLEWSFGGRSLRLRLLVKRVIDIAIALLGLVLLAPLWLVILLAIRLESPGSPLFRQTRIGKNGAPFEMFKFRTMVDGADDIRTQLAAAAGVSGLFKLTHDPRVTTLGRMLRRCSLDEIPQLINVLQGHMSLVGPRPLVPDEDRLVPRRYRTRLQVTPGITGPWQSIVPVRPPLIEMISLDRAYAETWSLWLDFKVLGRTLGHVARLRGV